MSARDRIRLTGLSAVGHHGVFDHERRDGQPFVTDVVLHLDAGPAAAGDDLARRLGLWRTAQASLAAQDEGKFDPEILPIGDVSKDEGPRPDTTPEKLAKLRALPDATRVYCGHEYTLSNARFALTVDPDNQALRERAAQVEALRARGAPTLPSTIGLERRTNPFLRPDDATIRRRLGLENASDTDVFAEIRCRKDRA